MNIYNFDELVLTKLPAECLVLNNELVKLFTAPIYFLSLYHI